MGDKAERPRPEYSCWLYYEGHRKYKKRSNLRKEGFHEGQVGEQADEIIVLETVGGH